MWASYRFVVIADVQEADGLKVIDLGAGHASSNETLAGRVLTALKSQELLNESVGAGYIDRKWPTALKESGAWPLSGLRQSFLNGSFTRLLDPDATLKGKVTRIRRQRRFRFGVGSKPDGNVRPCLVQELVSPDEIMFDGSAFLLTKAKAKQLKTAAGHCRPGQEPEQGHARYHAEEEETKPGEEETVRPSRALRIAGDVPPEIWNRVGTN